MNGEEEPKSDCGHKRGMWELTQVDDVVLWERARSGDRDSFAVLVDRHMAAVYRYCTRQVGSYQAAEDLTATVFLEAWRCRQRLVLSPSSLLLPLLYGIASRICSHHRRGARRFAAALRRLPRDPPAEDHAQQVVDSLQAKQRLRAVRTAINHLPREQREVVDLCLIGHMSIGAAARALGVAEGTVKSRLSRARARLRAESRIDGKAEGNG